MYRCAHCRNQHTLADEGRACYQASRHMLVAQFTPEPTPPVNQYTAQADPKMAFLADLLPALIDGRYAASRDGDDFLFFRVSRPKKGRLQGAVKIQSQHSDMLKDAFVLWPSARWSEYQRHRHAEYVETLLVVLADPRRAQLSYGRKLGQCCKCGKKLTDPRSRHYGIGPECEKFWPQIIAEVDQLEEEGVL